MATDINACARVVYANTLQIKVFYGSVVVDNYFIDSGCSEVDFNFIMDDQGNIIELQGTGEERPFSKAELDEMYALAKTSIDQLVQLQKEAIGDIKR